jgi:23S rRNA (cytosine1962-C5)-methyltransferase
MIIIKPGKAELLRSRRHPWIYSGAVERAEAGTLRGEPAPVAEASGQVLGWGLYSPRSLIAVRMITWGPEAPPEDWPERRIRAAYDLRQRLALESDAYRLVNAEGDFLPGLIVDVYRRTTVVRPLARGMESVLGRILAALRELYPDNAVFLKRDEKAARLEGLERPTGYLAGGGDGTERIREAGLEQVVDIARGQKTGYYLDQRDNRALTRRLSSGRRVLNLFAYTGSFALQAAAGGAVEVVSVESSAHAVEVAREGARLNPQLPAERITWVEGDALYYLQSCPAYDLVVVDPPPYARRRSELAGALKGYIRLNRLVLERCAPGALVLTFSCSSAVPSERFTDALRETARQAGREAQFLQALHAAPDHPVAAGHPEGEYLKGWLLRAL